MDVCDVLIVGAGHAGAQCALGLRQRGFDGSIVLLSAESVPPYERPPLSKDYLLGKTAPEQLLLRPVRAWQEQGIVLRLDSPVVEVAPDAGWVLDAHGRRTGYRHLVWAAGGEPRRLACEGAGLAGVQVLRGQADADALRAAPEQGLPVVVIGGGYLGLELAAALRGQGREVSVVETQPRLLARVTAGPLAAHVARLHRAHGVDFHLGVAVHSLQGRHGRVAGVRLDDGDQLPAGLVVAAIGLVPSTAVLERAGARVDDGILVDQRCRTSLPGVHAIGDCVRRQHPHGPAAMVRLESVPNAVEQAAIVVADLLGEALPAPQLPWFWSLQYGSRIQIAGLAQAHDQQVLRGDPDDAGFAVAYLRDSRLLALEAVNRPRDFMAARALAAQAAKMDPLRLADPGLPLAQCIQA